MLQFKKVSSNIKLFLAAVLPALLVVSLSVYVLGFKTTQAAYKAPMLPGQPLAAFDELYPVRSTPEGKLVLDLRRFEAAIQHLSKEPSPRAIADLLYMGSENNILIQLEPEAQKAYTALTAKVDMLTALQKNNNKDLLFQTYADIVNGIGQTFAGSPIEIVLHDTRNPLKSIVALQNPISGRRLGDPNTNFGLQLIKSYSQSPNVPREAYISYGLTLPDGRRIKSSTVPLFHETYGLIGFICINIDLEKLGETKPEQAQHFVRHMAEIAENTAISELIRRNRLTER